MKDVLFISFVGACALCLGYSDARAGAVVTREMVEQILGPSVMQENFTEFKAANRGAYAIDFQILNSLTVDQGQGPGLVQPDLSFSVQPFRPNDMNWWGPQSNGNAAEELAFLVGPGATGSISFAAPTPAFDMELTGLPENSFVTYGLTIYGPSGSLIDTQDVTLDGAMPVFFGYSASSGISRVDLFDSANQPVGIDFLLYSVPGHGSASPCLRRHGPASRCSVG